MTGLAFAHFIGSDDVLILEQSDEIGGWCKTVHQDGFVWDYSGHFFHFRDPDIEKLLVDQMPEGEVVSVAKDSRILYKGEFVDFPFQKNIHQLPHQEFLECLHGLVFRPPATDKSSFKDMLFEKFGHPIANKFLIPYNEKLYACDLDRLDRDAMGRFFPHASLEDIVQNFVAADNRSYNSTFTYPRNGAIMYVRALEKLVPEGSIALNEGLVSVNMNTKRAITNAGREISFDFLISSAPLPAFLDLCDVPFDTSGLSWNQVQVFNLGFDTKGLPDVHWVYVPDPRVSFYRVGYYDNIMGDARTSLYVELGFDRHDVPNPADLLPVVLKDLRATGLVMPHQQLVSSHQVLLNPAYVHITEHSRKLYGDVSRQLATRGVFSIGRYGGWTYCSIEDNVIEARELARMLAPFV
ncbi:MAG: FAD-dependent oxidoreductase [bacterium]